MSARLWIGLTGGIGSGKSTVSARWKSLGAEVLDADAIARHLLDRDGACYDAVVTAFGSGIVRADGTIDRKAVAAVVFADELQRQVLNGIIHPQVHRQMRMAAEKSLREMPEVPVIFDVPLLFECGTQKELDCSVLVCAREENAVARICLRDGCLPEQAIARIRAQMPLEQKRRLADYTIEKDATMEELIRQADALYLRIRTEHA